MIMDLWIKFSFKAKGKSLIKKYFLKKKKKITNTLTHLGTSKTINHNIEV